MSERKDASAAGGLDRGAVQPRQGALRSGGAKARGVTRRVASALGDAADHLESAASAVGAVVEATARRFDERPGARIRRVRRLGGVPLPYLDELHPDARRRTQRELGVRTIDVGEIAGTAVGPARQRGSDFLPLKPFRGANWAGRWQRLGLAADRLVVLPPIDVLRYDDRYWVVDGHNRVGMALYRGQASIDADVVDLVDSTRPHAGPSDAPESFASLVEDSRELRAAVQRATGAAPPARPAEPGPDPNGAPAADPNRAPAPSPAASPAASPGPAANPAPGPDPDAHRDPPR
jgi:hypothetical protein